MPSFNKIVHHTTTQPPTSSVNNSGFPLSQYLSQSRSTASNVVTTREALGQDSQNIFICTVVVSIWVGIILVCLLLRAIYDRRRGQALPLGFDRFFDTVEHRYTPVRAWLSNGAERVRTLSKKVAQSGREVGERFRRIPITTLQMVRSNKKVASGEDPSPPSSAC